MDGIARILILSGNFAEMGSFFLSIFVISEKVEKMGCKFGKHDVK
jgi:hypothetical protein